MVEMLSPLSDFAAMIAGYFAEIWEFLIFIGRVSAVIVVLAGAILWFTEANAKRGKGLVFSGILERYPSLKFINHHAGGMIPFFERRMTSLCNMAERRVGANIKQNLAKSPRNYFRMFYNDTAIGGSTAALMCTYDFCGAKKMLFGTDMPFDMELGNEAIRETIRSVEGMDIPDVEKQAIFEDNARRLLLLD